MFPVTIVIHGRDEESKEQAAGIREAIQAGLTYDERRKITVCWDNEPNPNDELMVRVELMAQTVNDLRDAYFSTETHMTKEGVEAHLRRLGEAELAMTTAAQATGHRFVPSDKQIAWAMNVAGVMPTSAGHTLEDLLPEAEYAHFVRQIVAAAQDPNAERNYPDHASVLAAARARGLEGACYGDLIVEGKPQDEAPHEVRNAAEMMIPDGAKLMGFGPHAWRGFQVDYELPDKTRGSTFRLGIAPKAFGPKDTDGNA